MSTNVKASLRWARVRLHKVRHNPHGLNHGRNNGNRVIQKTGSEWIIGERMLPMKTTVSEDKLWLIDKIEAFISAVRPAVLQLRQPVPEICPV